MKHSPICDYGSLPPKIRRRQEPQNLTHGKLVCDFPWTCGYASSRHGNGEQMKRLLPSNDQVNLLFDGSSSSTRVENDSIQSIAVDGPVIESTPEVIDYPLIYFILSPCIACSSWIIAEMQFRLAKSYQEYVKLIPIPVECGTVIPHISWIGLGNSIERIYRQPLHCLTYLHLKQLDKERIGAKDEDVPLDMIIHPCKAESSIWIIEEIHRNTSSPHHLSKLWENYPSHHALVDAIFPKL